MYCVKCKKHTETTDVQLFTARNSRLMQRGICSVCGKTKTQFVKAGSGLFNKAVSNLPFELHLPGHNHFFQRLSLECFWETANW